MLYNKPVATYTKVSKVLNLFNWKYALFFNYLNHFYLGTLVTYLFTFLKKPVNIFHTNKI